LFLALWQLATGVLFPQHSLLFPPPSDVVREAIFLIVRGELWKHMLMSLIRVVLGFACGFAIGVPVAIGIGRFRLLSDTIEPILEMVRPIPPLAWIPLSILWFGIGTTQNVFIIFLAGFIAVFTTTVAGVRSIDIHLVWSALNLGCPKNRVLWDVVLPNSLPFILTGARLGLAGSWMCLVAAELVAASSGLGFMIMDARQLLLSERVLVGMVVIGLLGFLMDRGVKYLETHSVPWFYRGKVT
jgi:ABC-type nitrate/sulfonate/bicarbonate transport system permease component